MEIFEAIHTRRSIRRFVRGRPVSEDTIKGLIMAGMAAPSAGNEQPWQFVVIEDRDTLAAVEEITPYGAIARTGAAGILVCGDMRHEAFPGNWVCDCSAATQNILLAAHARNIGAVWIGIYPDPERMRKMAELVSLPADVKPLSLVAIGHPAEAPKREYRYLPERVHHETFSRKQ